ncbi:unnamed protein product, partial [Effrenium voratum]
VGFGCGGRRLSGIPAGGAAEHGAVRVQPARGHPQRGGQAAGLRRHCAGGP